MTKAKISEYDAVAANNTDVNGVNIAEGCPPSGMNNMGREIMAALKRFQVGSDGDGVTVGGNLVVSGSSTVNTFTAGPVSATTLNTSGAVVFNDAGADVDFRVEGDTDANLLFVDAGNDRVGIGTGTPLCRFDMREGNRANSTNIANLGVYTTNDPAIDFGGSIALGGRFNSGSASEAPFGSIRGGKENSTNNNYAGYLAFQTIADNSALVERMRIDSSGNVLVGTTGAAYSTSGRGLIETNGSSSSMYALKVGGTGVGYFAASSSVTELAAVGASQPLLFTTNGSEAMRIDSSGNLLVGTTSNTANFKTNIQFDGGAVNGLYLRQTNASAGDPDFIFLSDARTLNNTSNSAVYADATATRWVLRKNGGLANYSANDVNLSDRREKTNFAPAKNYLDTICAIPVQTFNYIDQNLEEDDGLTLGVVAQDVQEVAPELVMESNWGTQEEPKMRLSIYQTDLQYALMKCIQELKAELDTVKAELATLKG